MPIARRCTSAKLGQPELLAKGNSTDAPGCLVKQAVNAALGETFDYVIVPAVERHDDPTALAWIRSQAEKGATIVSVCVGATVVGAAGLLDGRRATTHWYSLKQPHDEAPTVRYVANRRLVVDGAVATTTGTPHPCR